MSDTNLETCNTTPDNQNVNPVPRRRSIPSIDVFEVANQYRLDVDLPGASRESIQLDIDQRVLTLSADRRPNKADRHHVAGRGPTEGYYRRLRIGEDIDPTAISANYADGVLRITLPKKQSARKRSIEIQKPA